MKNLVGILRISLILFILNGCASSETDLKVFKLRFENQYWETLHQLKLNQTIWRDSLVQFKSLDTLLFGGIYDLEVTTHSNVILKTTFKLTGTSYEILLSLDSMSHFQLK